MLEDGRIERSYSSWASPVVMVPKQQPGVYRLCVDYRKLNRVTKLDAYPMPTIDSILDSLHGATIFSSLDLKSGYHQMALNPEDKEKTAFVCAEGLFHFTVLPFGVVNGPASFQRLMEVVLDGLIGTICYVYLDDIVCFSSSLSRHVDGLRQILQRLQTAGLTVNWDKCAFGRSSMRYLGHVIGSDGLRTVPEKVRAIVDYPMPKTVKQLERFLGMVTWYAKFIPNLATITAPLNQLRQKNTTWTWTSGHSAAFEELKQILMSEPVLTYPDLSQPFVVHTDASDTGLGAVLLQGTDDQLHAIAYASRSLSPPERNYSTTERECLAVIWALEKWRFYLEGKRCQVVTDHQALTWLFRKAQLTGRLARWVLRLQDFSFDITYRRGELHVVPDALSRVHDDFPLVGIIQGTNVTQTPAVIAAVEPPPSTGDHPDATAVAADAEERCAAVRCIQPMDDVVHWIQCDGCMEWFHIVCVHIKKTRAEDMPTYACPTCKRKRWETRRNVEWASGTTPTGVPAGRPLPDLTTVRKEQLQDLKLTALRDKASPVYRERDGILYHYNRSKWKLVVPDALKHAVLETCHCHPTAGHLGRTKTLHKLDSLHLWWKGCATEVRSFLRTCHTCRTTKPLYRKPAGFMLTTQSGGPWETVGVDLMGPLPKSYGGHEYLLVAVDHYSKWVEAIPIRKATGKEVASVLVRQLFCRYGGPQKLLSDNGSQFICRAVNAVCKEWGVQQLYISPYHPQGNWVERVNRNLKGMMRAYVGDDHRTWDVHIAEFAFALNSVHHETIGVAPSLLMLGRQLVTPLENKWCTSDRQPQEDRADLTHRVALHRKQATLKQKAHYDKRRRPPDVTVGQQVMVQTHPRSDAGKHFNAKLAPKWSGPYLVTQRLTPVNLKVSSLTDHRKQLIVHMDQVKLCTE